MTKSSRTPQTGRARSRGVATTVTGRRREARQRRMPERTPDFDTRTAVAHILTTMRQQGVSLTHAIKGTGRSRDAVLRAAGPALRRSRSGRYVAARHDRLPRLVRVPDKHGTREIVVRNSIDATRVAELWNAVHKFLATGDGSALELFRGEYVTDIHGQHIPLFIGRTTLKLLGRAGVLSFESIYARAR